MWQLTQRVSAGGGGEIPPRLWGQFFLDWGGASIQHAGVFEGKTQSRWGARIATLLISAGLLYVVGRRLDLPTFLNVIREASWGGILAAASIFGLGLIFGAWRWHMMLRLGGNVVHPGASLRGTLMGHCFHTFLFGAAGGDLVKSGIYARWFGLKMSEVLAAAPLDRLIALVGAILFGISMVLVGAMNGGFSVLAGRDLWLPLVWIGVLAVLVVITIVGVYRWRPTRFQSLERFRATLQGGGLSLVGDRRLLFKCIVAAVGVHACLSLTMVTCLAAVTRAPVSWLAVIWLFPVISMISGLPVSVGGAGLREGSALVLLGLFQVPPEDAVAASMFTLAVSFCWCFVGLAVWRWGERRFHRYPLKPLPETISVVIPTINEVKELGPTVEAVQGIPEVVEVLVADGGSDDGTPELASSLGCQVVMTPPGRGTQMRVAARQARGDVVWMLHADTRVPPDAGRVLLNTFRDPLVAGGGFWKAFDRSSIWMLGSRFRCLIRWLVARRMMGDQAIFIRRDALEAIGGVPDVPLMEEFELCRTVRREGTLALADGTVITSGRKFRGLGALRTYGLMWMVTVRYYLGTPVSELAKIYSKR